MKASTVIFAVGIIICEVITVCRLRRGPLDDLRSTVVYGPW